MTARPHDAILTPAEAAAMHRDATAADVWLVWFVLTDDPAFPGRHVARAHTADHHGGTWLPGALVTDALGELCTMLPDGLTRRDPGADLSAGRGGVLGLTELVTAAALEKTTERLRRAPP